jgi:hypothetical protein
VCVEKKHAHGTVHFFLPTSRVCCCDCLLRSSVAFGCCVCLVRKMFMCEFDEAVVKHARMRAAEMGVLPNSFARGEGAVVGFIGEACVKQALRAHGVQSMIYDSADYDLVAGANDTKLEVKTMHVRSAPNLDVTVNPVLATSRLQRADLYVFARVAFDDVSRLEQGGRAYFCGAFPCAQLTQAGKLRKQGDVVNGFPVRRECWTVFSSECLSWQDMVGSLQSASAKAQVQGAEAHVQGADMHSGENKSRGGAVVSDTDCAPPMAKVPRPTGQSSSSGTDGPLIGAAAQTAESAQSGTAQSAQGGTAQSAQGRDTECCLGGESFAGAVVDGGASFLPSAALPCKCRWGLVCYACCVRNEERAARSKAAGTPECADAIATDRKCAEAAGQ